ncbi:MAG: hypothetical protein AVDCRST_MAG88-3501, partial [uncultured Thermomicrobiales bacterium]
MAEPIAATPVGPSPARLVGRGRELVLLRERLAGALAGRGALVLLAGEAGIGKTALAEATLAEARQRGATVLVGRCHDLAETPPYGPWVEALARAPRDPGHPPLPAALAAGDAAGDADGQAALFRQA